MNKICSVDDCSSETYGRLDFCRKHHANFKRNGKPVVDRPRERHEMYGTPEYRAWFSMLGRCRPEAKAHEYYYDRGIIVCEDWNKSFLAFYKYVGNRPSATHSIDRIDNNKGYEPGNVRWASKSTQSRNQRLGIRNTSGYRGVHWYKSSNKWTAAIRAMERKIHLGYFSNKEEAALAYNQAAIKYHGVDAQLNDIKKLNIGDK